jgi:hypothetical protein
MMPHLRAMCSKCRENAGGNSQVFTERPAGRARLQRYCYCIAFGALAGVLVAASLGLSHGVVSRLSDASNQGGENRIPTTTASMHTVITAIEYHGLMVVSAPIKKTTGTDAIALTRIR